MDNWTPPPRGDRGGRKGPLWEDGVSGWENAPEYGSGPTRWWHWPIYIAGSALLLTGCAWMQGLLH
jgi:hypothetical protein